MLFLVSIEPLGLGFQVQHSPFWANLVYATSEIFKLLFLLYPLEIAMRMVLIN